MRLPLYMNSTFPFDNDYELPEPAPQRFSADLCAHVSWLPYNRRNIKRKAAVGVHFFLDDYRFDYLFQRYRQSVTTLFRFAFVCAPDFSLYANMPYPLQLWQVYRSRWLACYWASQGLHVIPTLQWGDESTYDFCFTGIPQGQVLAVSGLSPRFSGEETGRYLDGLERVQQTLSPSLLLVFGGLKPENLTAPHLHVSLNTFYRVKKNGR